MPRAMSAIFRCCCRSAVEVSDVALPSTRSGPDSQSRALSLPHDELYEILLRVPAKDLCRFRAVCRQWRHLLSDPQFIAAHAALHPETLIVVGYDTLRDDGVICSIMDMSGRIVKQVQSTRDEERVTAIHLDFICISNERSARLLNLATGAVIELPEELTEEHAAHELETCRFRASHVFGQVASSGEYKVLRVLEPLSLDYQGQLCEVFTLGGGDHAQWRGTKAPTNDVLLGLWNSVVVDGIAYFLSPESIQGQEVAALDRFASFDLETEEWRATLRGPISNLVDACDGSYLEFSLDEFLLTAMNGCLVVVHLSIWSRVDLWFLRDFERGLWVKQHSIKVKLYDQAGSLLAVRPMLVLNDGRIVLVYIRGSSVSVKIDNPRTNTSTYVSELGVCSPFGLYTGSLLRLSNGAS